MEMNIGLNMSSTAEKHPEFAQNDFFRVFMYISKSR